MKLKTIQEVFDKKKCLVAYLMVGDPDLETSVKLIEDVAKTVDIVELGVPFSDPIADGPVIQQAAMRAMAGKAQIANMLEIVRGIREKGIETPIITMLYYNLVMQYGVRKFVEDLVQVGLNGALIPDLPLEEGKVLRELFREAGLDFPMLVTPTTPPARALEIADAASGFLYYVSYTGTTGANTQLDYRELKKQVESLRSQVKLPVAIGFGIKDNESVAEILKIADGAVVGSAIIKVIEENLGKANLGTSVMEFVKSLAEAAK